MNGLFRTPDSWARDWGWVSRRRALNMARKLNEIADAIEGAMADDEDVKVWTHAIRDVGKKLAPKTVPAQRKHARAERLERQAAR
jgi:hypothetical protein